MRFESLGRTPVSTVGDFVGLAEEYFEFEGNSFERYFIKSYELKVRTDQRWTKELDVVEFTVVTDRRDECGFFERAEQVVEVETFRILAEEVGFTKIEPNDYVRLVEAGCDFEFILLYGLRDLAAARALSLARGGNS
jgi:hypothetical protein